MTRHVLEKYKTSISRFTLVPSGRGKFEITADGKTVFSKLKEGRFPENDEIVSRLASGTGTGGPGTESCCSDDERGRRIGAGFRSFVAKLLRKAG